MIWEKCPNHKKYEIKIKKKQKSQMPLFGSPHLLFLNIYIGFLFCCNSTLKLCNRYYIEICDWCFWKKSISCNMIARYICKYKVHLEKLNLKNNVLLHRVAMFYYTSRNRFTYIDSVMDICGFGVAHQSIYYLLSTCCVQRQSNKPNLGIKALQFNRPI